MARPTNLLGSGIAAGAADAIVGYSASTLTATGTTNADALQLGADINDVTTTASGTGVRLPPTERGSSIFVSNLGANALLVYPSVGSQINALAVTTGGFSIPAGKSAWFIASSGTKILTNLSA